MFATMLTLCLFPQEAMTLHPFEAKASCTSYAAMLLSASIVVCSSKSPKPPVLTTRPLAPMAGPAICLVGSMNCFVHLCFQNIRSLSLDSAEAAQNFVLVNRLGDFQVGVNGLTDDDHLVDAHGHAFHFVGTLLFE